MFTLGVCIYTLLFVLQNVNQNAVHSFGHVRSYCNSDYALAGLIREIREMIICVNPGFECSELEQVVYTAIIF